MIRSYVVDKYAELLGLPKDHTTCVNLEKNTHNWAVKRSISLGDTAAADNHRHMNRYKHKFLQIQYNLKKSPVLKEKIVNGTLKTSGVVELSPQALWSDGPYARQMEECISKSLKKEYSSNVLKDPNYKGIFRCNRCKSYKTTYYEMQTRSADEPMTVFITCHSCDSRWKS
jgi:DNA-directed RNA polymerase subunit M/transcription elongation factor TFIIS